MSELKRKIFYVSFLVFVHSFDAPFPLCFPESLD
jgi:hypothetical protein